MFIDTRMYVYVYVCIYVFCMHWYCMYMYVHASINVQYTRIYVCIHTDVCIRVHVYVHTHKSLHPLHGIPSTSPRQAACRQVVRHKIAVANPLMQPARRTGAPGARGDSSAKLSTHISYSLNS